MVTWRLETAPALEGLRTLAAGAVQCVVTSPPYWGLRDYGMAEQIGLEASPAEYVAALVAVFGEVGRVLADDGVVWLNLGDSYNSNSDMPRNDVKAAAGLRALPRQIRAISLALKPKDLIGIPWRVAFALQAAGWYLRSDVIWSKPNPMPESVTDRPTKAHEYVFLLSKSARYRYDAAAISELLSARTLERFGGIPVRTESDGGGTISRSLATGSARTCGAGSDGRRNVRTVWEIGTEASPYDHYAVMPKALARRCILAGCPAGATVLDPFAGVATTGVVALEEGRAFVGIELSPKYAAMGRARLADTVPLLAREAPAVAEQGSLLEALG